MAGATHTDPQAALRDQMIADADLVKRRWRRADMVDLSTRTGPPRTAETVNNLARFVEMYRNGCTAGAIAARLNLTDNQVQHLRVLARRDGLI
ncbi:hypothetical protein ACFO5X_06315 [Seohaeicola nanhaiensis]|uniref:MarR family transcriptional regulator n=1 Tax=Seohaeicola nanhaiensis TaxID=1387282 RepID=A0ABV9KDI9_9RHOB